MPVRKIAFALGAALALLLSLASAALAGDHPCPPPGRVAQLERSLHRLDADGDGALSAAELGPAARIVLARADADGNGQVSLTELVAHACHRDGA